MVNCIGVRTDRYVNKHIFTIYCILVYLCIVQFLLTLLKGIIALFIYFFYFWHVISLNIPLNTSVPDLHPTASHR